MRKFAAILIIICVILLFSVYKVAQGKENLVVLICDVSLSMNFDLAGTNGTRMDAVKPILIDFVNNLDMKDRKLALISFAGTAVVESPPTNNKSIIIDKISKFRFRSATNIESALKKAVALSKDFETVTFILVSDGASTFGNELKYTRQNLNTTKYTVHTVGFIGDSDVDFETLQNISSLTGGKSYYAGSKEELDQVFYRLDSDWFVENVLLVISLIVLVLMWIYGRDK